MVFRNKAGLSINVLLLPIAAVLCLRLFLVNDFFRFSLSNRLLSISLLHYLWLIAQVGGMARILFTSTVVTKKSSNNQPKYVILLFSSAKW